MAAGVGEELEDGCPMERGEFMSDGADGGDVVAELGFWWTQRAPSSGAAEWRKRHHRPRSLDFPVPTAGLPNHSPPRRQSLRPRGGGGGRPGRIGVAASEEGTRIGVGGPVGGDAGQRGRGHHRSAPRHPLRAQRRRPRLRALAHEGVSGGPSLLVLAACTPSRNLVPAFRHRARATAESSVLIILRLPRPPCHGNRLSASRRRCMPVLLTSL